MNEKTQGIITKLKMEGDGTVQNLSSNDSQSFISGRFVAGTIALIAGYYFYVKFFNKNHEDKTDEFEYNTV